jgi:hypothetical protein
MTFSVFLALLGMTFCVFSLCVENVLITHQNVTFQKKKRDESFRTKRGTVCHSEQSEERCVIPSELRYGVSFRTK